jgi:hypothetical protein
MQPFLGKFNIEKCNLEKFWKFYCDGIFNNGDKFLCGISEKPNPYMPILGDIDIQVSAEDDQEYNTHLYSEEQVKTIVSIYIDIWTIKYEFLLDTYRRT